LGAIVLLAAKHLIRVEDLRHLRSVSRAEFGIAILALVAVLAFGLLDGILIAAVGSLALLIAQASRPPIAVVGRDPATGGYLNRALHPGIVGIPGALILRTPVAWVYFNADHLRRMVLDLLGKSPEKIAVVILEFSMVPAVDVTAAAALKMLARTLRARGVALEIADMRDEVAADLRANDVGDDVDTLEPHRSIAACLAAHGLASGGAAQA
jgi:MFS superfamily sulfate permease-like transporter